MLPADAYLPDGWTPNDNATVRSVFIIGPDKQPKLSMTYPMTVGRNLPRSSEHLMRFNCRLAKALQRRQIGRPVRM